MGYQKYKLSQRMSKSVTNDKFETDQYGMFFKNDNQLKPVDMRNFEILHTGLDTLEQKYTGAMNPQLLEKTVFTKMIDHLGNARLVPVDYPKKTMNINGVKCRITRAPAKSGYRYQIQNKSVGILIFFGHFHNKDWITEGAIKVRFSPQFIYREGVQKTAIIADEFANEVLYNPVHSGVSVHMCMDVQGWAPEQEFMSNVKTRTRIKRAMPSAGSIDGNIDLSQPFLDHNEIGVRYDSEKSFLFGKSNSGQMAIYSKLEEAKKSNKFTYWESVYRKHMSYDPTKDVFRVEGRLPDGVLSKLGQPEKGGSGECYNIKSIHDVIDHIPALWKYCLYDLFRYQYKDTNIVRPEWQYLAEAPFMNLQDTDYQYQRVKVTQSGSDSDRNIAQLLGHLAAYCAKEDVPNEKIESLLYNFPQINVINKYFKGKGKHQEQWISEFIEKVEDKRIDLAPCYESPWPDLKGYTPRKPKEDDDILF